MPYPDGMTAASLDAYNGRDERDNDRDAALLDNAHRMISAAWDEIASWPYSRTRRVEDAIDTALSLLTDALDAIGVAKDAGQ